MRGILFFLFCARFSFAFYLSFFRCAAFVSSKIFYFLVYTSPEVPAKVPGEISREVLARPETDLRNPVAVVAAQASAAVNLKKIKRNILNSWFNNDSSTLLVDSRSNNNIYKSGTDLNNKVEGQ